MIWWIINIILLVAGGVLVYYGWKEGQQSEAYHAIAPFFGGLIIFVVGCISSFVKSIWF